MIIVFLASHFSHRSSSYTTYVVLPVLINFSGTLITQLRLFGCNFTARCCENNVVKLHSGMAAVSKSLKENLYDQSFSEYVNRVTIHTVTYLLHNRPQNQFHLDVLII